MPRQAAYLAAHRVPGRAYAFAPRRRYPRAPGRPNYQHRSEFRFFSPEDIQRPLKYPHVRPQMGNLATASRRESDPFPQPGLGAYKGTLWDPAAKIAPGQVARNSNLKFGVRPSTLAIKQPMRIKTPTKANINAAPPSSTVRVVPYPVRAVKALGQRYLSRAACEKTADVCGSPRRRLRVVGMIHIY